MTKNNHKEAYSYNSFLPWKQLEVSANDVDFFSDSRLGQVYLEDQDLKLVTEIAIVTGRPLLLRGESGSGKSSFAPFIARNLDWNYYEFNITGRTEARELLWKFDALRRLRDAQAGERELKIIDYITPNVLWWAFNFQQAFDFVKNDKKKIPFAEINSNRNSVGSVVLIDEIDKADPNVPNDLLEVIGMNSFTVEEINEVIKRPQTVFNPSPINPIDYGNLLIVITTNEERDLPVAFLRRCIVHNLNEPTGQAELTQRWIEIAKLHLGKNYIQNDKNTEKIEKIVADLANKSWELREETANEIRRSPSVAEFLDALKTCLRLNIDVDTKIWEQVKQSVLTKRK